MTTIEAKVAHGKALGHLALHYAPGDGPKARRLLELLGCQLVDNGPSPGTDGFCTVLVNGEDASYADNLMFLSCMSDEQAALEATIRGALGIGGADEPAEVATFRQAMVAKPESTSHIGLRFAALADLEAVLAGLEAAAAPGGELEGRIALAKYRPLPSGESAEDDAQVAEMVAASPAFTGDEPTSFAKHWIQCFVTTDLCGFGLLAFGSIFEVDFVFDPFFREPPWFGPRPQA
jgi:hypothetical protein